MDILQLLADLSSLAGQWTAYESHLDDFSEGYRAGLQLAARQLDEITKRATAEQARQLRMKAGFADCAPFASER